MQSPEAGRGVCGGREAQACRDPAAGTGVEDRCAPPPVLPLVGAHAEDGSPGRGVRACGNEGRVAPGPGPCRPEPGRTLGILAPPPPGRREHRERSCLWGSRDPGLHRTPTFQSAQGQAPPCWGRSCQLAHSRDTPAVCVLGLQTKTRGPEKPRSPRGVGRDTRETGWGLTPGVCDSRPSLFTAPRGDSRVAGCLGGLSACAVTRPDFPAFADSEQGRPSPSQEPTGHGPSMPGCRGGRGASADTRGPQPPLGLPASRGCPSLWGPRAPHTCRAPPTGVELALQLGLARAGPRAHGPAVWTGPPPPFHCEGPHRPPGHRLPASDRPIPRLFSAPPAQDRQRGQNGDKASGARLPLAGVRCCRSPALGCGAAMERRPSRRAEPWPQRPALARATVRVGRTLEACGRRTPLHRLLSTLTRANGAATPVPLVDAGLVHTRLEAHFSGGKIKSPNLQPRWLRLRAQLPRGILCLPIWEGTEMRFIRQLRGSEAVTCPLLPRGGGGGHAARGARACARPPWTPGTPLPSVPGHARQVPA